MIWRHYWHSLALLVYRYMKNEFSFSIIALFKSGERLYILSMSSTNLHIIVLSYCQSQQSINTSTQGHMIQSFMHTFVVFVCVFVCLFVWSMTKAANVKCTFTCTRSIIKWASSTLLPTRKSLAAQCALKLQEQHIYCLYMYYCIVKLVSTLQAA